MSTTFEIGELMPTMDLLITGNQHVNLTHYIGQPLALYFYPKANTPGCTQEGLDFATHYTAFRQNDCQILGASRDGLKAQENFKTKHQFPFDLVADKEQRLCQAMDVIKLKKMYGRESLGIERSTFLFDAEGRLRHAWRGVKVKGHVEVVLQALNTI